MPPAHVLDRQIFTKPKFATLSFSKDLHVSRTLLNSKSVQTKFNWVWYSKEEEEGEIDKNFSWYYKYNYFYYSKYKFGNISSKE